MLVSVIYVAKKLNKFRRSPSSWFRQFTSYVGDLLETEVRQKVGGNYYTVKNKWFIEWNILNFVVKLKKSPQPDLALIQWSF